MNLPMMWVIPIVNDNIKCGGPFFDTNQCVVWANNSGNMVGLKYVVVAVKDLRDMSLYTYGYFRTTNQDGKFAIWEKI